jgi:hypothetical protein
MSSFSPAIPEMLVEATESIVSLLSGGDHGLPRQRGSAAAAGHEGGVSRLRSLET